MMGWGHAKDVTFYMYGDGTEGDVGEGLAVGDVAAGSEDAVIYGTPQEMGELGLRLLAQFGESVKIPVTEEIEMVKPVIGVVEWLSSSGTEPTVFLADNVTDLNRAVAEHLEPMIADIEDIDAEWIAEHPRPDMDDPGAVESWLTALNEASTDARLLVYGHADKPGAETYADLRCVSGGGEVHDRDVQIFGFTTAEQVVALREACGMRPGDLGRWKGNDTITIDRDPWIDRAIDWARRNGRAYDVTMSQRFEGRHI